MQQLEDLCAFFRFVGLVVAQKRLFYSEVGQQPERYPGILGGDIVHAFQRFYAAR